jgi:hypothetical protein
MFTLCLVIVISICSFYVSFVGIVHGLIQNMAIRAPPSVAGTDTGTDTVVTCDPPAPVCFADGLVEEKAKVKVNHTSVQSSLFMAGCARLLSPVQALELLPFLKVCVRVCVCVGGGGGGLLFCTCFIG